MNILNSVIDASQFALLYGEQSTFIVAFLDEADYKDNTPIIPRWSEFCDIARENRKVNGESTSLYWALVQRPRSWRSDSDLKTWILRNEGFKEFREWVIEKIPEDGKIYLVLICPSKSALEAILSKHTVDKS